MQAVKVFNNNAVSVVMPDGREAILVGNGLGFGRRPGDVIDKSRVSKVYYVQNELQTKFLKMLDNVTPQVMQAAERISLAAEEQGILLSSKSTISLVDHISFALERVEKGTFLPNLMLSETRMLYPKEYAVGQRALELVRQFCGVQLPEDEAGYIALHLGAASERINSVRKYRTIMIIPHNQTFSDMCVKKISEMFRERVDVVGTFRYFEEETVSSLDPDLILTTFPLEHKLDVPTVPINLFVDSETESNILQAVNKLDKKQFQLEFTSHIGSLIRKEHFHENVTLGTPEEIIRLLCHGLEKEGIVEPGFKDIVLKREQMSPTSFVNAFAIPHAFGAFASHSTIAVAQLKSPVRWGNFDVGLVMLFAINEGDERMIKIFFDWVSNVVNRPEELAKIVSSCTYEEFIDRIMG